MPYARSASVRAEVLRRAAGICAGCSVDTVALRARAWEGRESAAAYRYLRRRKFDPHMPMLQHDHTIPLALGGEDTVQNGQAMCTPCHHLKTAQDRKDIARAARWSGPRKTSGRLKHGRKIHGRGFANRKGKSA